MKIDLKTWIIAGTAIINIPFITISCLTDIKKQEKQEIQEIREIQEIENSWTVKKYIDPETGVNYLIFDHYGKCGATVRVDKEGKPIIS